MTVHAGSWLGLPDFGITEAIQRIVSPQTQYTAQGGSNLLGGQKAQTVPTGSYYPNSVNNYGKGIPQVLGSNTSNIPTNNIPSSGGGGALPGYQQAVSTVQNQASSGNDQIESDYNNAMSALSGQENTLRGQAETATNQIGSNVASTQNEIQNAQTGAVNDVQNQATVAQKSGQTAMQQARDLFRQSQQQNIAQLSALGLSSSSVMEGLAEKLGTVTAQRLASISGSIQDIQQNAAKEVARVNTYYQGKKTDLTNWANDQKASIQNALMAGLNQINSARNQAASDKAQARSNLINNVQNALSSLSSQYAQFAQSLEGWATQKTNALQQVATSTDWANSQSGAANTFNQNFTTPTLNAPAYSNTGYSTLKGSTTAKKTYDPTDPSTW